MTANVVWNLTVPDTSLMFNYNSFNRDCPRNNGVLQCTTGSSHVSNSTTSTVSLSFFGTAVYLFGTVDDGSQYTLQLDGGNAINGSPQADQKLLGSFSNFANSPSSGLAHTVKLTVTRFKVGSILRFTGALISVDTGSPSAKPSFTSTTATGSSANLNLTPGWTKNGSYIQSGSDLSQTATFKFQGSGVAVYGLCSNTRDDLGNYYGAAQVDVSPSTFPRGISDSSDGNLFNAPPYIAEDCLMYFYSGFNEGSHNLTWTSQRDNVFISRFTAISVNGGTAPSDGTNEIDGGTVAKAIGIGVNVIVAIVVSVVAVLILICAFACFGRCRRRWRQQPYNPPPAPVPVETKEASPPANPMAALPVATYLPPTPPPAPPMRTPSVPHRSQGAPYQALDSTPAAAPPARAWYGGTLSPEVPNADLPYRPDFGVLAAVPIAPVGRAPVPPPPGAAMPYPTSTEWPRSVPSQPHETGPYAMAHASPAFGSSAEAGYHPSPSVMSTAPGLPSARTGTILTSTASHTSLPSPSSASPPPVSSAQDILIDTPITQSFAGRGVIMSADGVHDAFPSKASRSAGEAGTHTSSGEQSRHAAFAPNAPPTYAAAHPSPPRAQTGSSSADTGDHISPAPGLVLPALASQEPSTSASSSQVPTAAPVPLSPDLLVDTPVTQAFAGRGVVMSAEGVHDTSPPKVSPRSEAANGASFTGQQSQPPADYPPPPMYAP
ncbi:hypothetical protein EXIGLDRAFT_834325 [Exidia glandulosa HHB12029]|uniref:Uncharacterized protein n=1 Tax=Exidia glandulosa HHB12029 TaxID=1314781 RepID=A0A165JY81_EXIGL|nr:hypothetical protein EXIGLDRAFT_834325 [Exidia glandulosa HHB12029]